MKKFGIAASLAAIVATLGIVLGAGAASAAEPCKRTAFKTNAVKAACAKGGQAAAKTDMKAFLKAAKAKQSDLTCNSCHTKLAPAYDLKPTGLALYTKLGGK